MSESIRFSIRRAGSRVLLSRLLLGLGGCLALGLVLGANGPGGPGGTGNNFASDEMVGTLPSTQGWGPVRHKGMPDRALASFYVEGAWQRVVRIATQAEGSGHVALEITDLGELRAVFHGQVRVHLHPLSFHDGELRAGILFGAESGMAAVGIFHGPRMVSKTVHDVRYALPMPMEHLVDSGVLDTGLVVVTSTPLVGRSIVSLEMAGGSLDIAQSF